VTQAVEGQTWLDGLPHGAVGDGGAVDGWGPGASAEARSAWVFAVDAREDVGLAVALEFLGESVARKAGSVSVRALAGVLG
jgi:hypothetical protein